MHQRPGFHPWFRCQAHFKKLYSFLYTKDVVMSKGIYVRILSDSCFGFHTPNTWLQARWFLMSGYCQTVVDYSASNIWLQAIVLMSKF